MIDNSEEYVKKLHSENNCICDACFYTSVNQDFNLNRIRLTKNRGEPEVSISVFLPEYTARHRLIEDQQVMVCYFDAIFYGLDIPINVFDLKIPADFYLHHTNKQIISDILAIFNQSSLTNFTYDDWHRVNFNINVSDLADEIQKIEIKQILNLLKNKPINVNK
jgi:hypothetical protein